MNVTFFIGNGFDISLGLKTSYEDFYNWYIKKYPNSYFAELITSERKNWADLETGLGEHTKCITPEQFTEFLDEKEELENRLAEYLFEQQSAFTLPQTPEFAKEFIEHTTNFFKEFSGEQRTHYNNLASNNSGKSFTFVTLNYTSVLDSIIRYVNEYFKKQSQSSPFSSLVYHVHGEIEQLVLGVDNANQISNADLREQCSCFIKPLVNQRLGDGIISRLHSIINGSEYICIYGASCGVTDQSWWSYIVDWLQKDIKRRLVLYVYEANGRKRSAQGLIRFWDEQINLFLERSGKKPQRNLSNQIIVIPNSKIFTFSSISKKELAANGTT